MCQATGKRFKPTTHINCRFYTSCIFFIPNPVYGHIFKSNVDGNYKFKCYKKILIRKSKSVI